MEEDPLLYVAVQGAGADSEGKSRLPGLSQRRRRGIPFSPVHFSIRLDAQHFVFQEFRVGVVISDFEGPALGGLVVDVYLLSFVWKLEFLSPGELPACTARLWSYSVVFSS